VVVTDESALDLTPGYHGWHYRLLDNQCWSHLSMIRSLATVHLVLYMSLQPDGILSYIFTVMLHVRVACMYIS